MIQGTHLYLILRSCHCDHAHYVSYQTTIETTDLDYLHVTIEKHISVSLRRNQGARSHHHVMEIRYSENGQSLISSGIFGPKEEIETTFFGLMENNLTDTNRPG